MISLLVAGFIFYLYAPHLLFKFAAATKYDLITRKEIPQVEEFFAAGLPGFFLNVQAAIILRIVLRLRSLRAITVDWDAVALVFQKDPDLSPYLRGIHVEAFIKYAVALGVTSWVAGWVYGLLRRRIALAGGQEVFLRRNQAHLSISGLAAFSVRALGILNSRFWDTFYEQYQHPFYPVVLRRSYAFVHTTRNLYHGIVYSADKRRDGDIEGIVLLNVSKFSRGRDVELIRSGTNPISDLTGPLFVKWSEITDINYPPDGGILKRKRAEYDEMIKAWKSRKDRRRTFLLHLPSSTSKNFHPREP